MNGNSWHPRRHVAGKACKFIFIAGIIADTINMSFPGSRIGGSFSLCHCNPTRISLVKYSIVVFLVYVAFNNNKCLLCHVSVIVIVYNCRGMALL